MNVCHIKVGEFLSPTETFVYRRVCDRELEQSVLALKRANAQKYPLPPSVRFHALSETSRLQQWINSRWLNHRGQSPWITKNIVSSRPDVVHAHFGAAGWAALPACEKKRIPLIVTLYGSDFHTVYKKDPTWRQRTDILFQKADFVSVISDFMIKEVQNAGCDPKKLVKIRCGIDLQELPFSSKELLNGEPLRILCVARLHPVKRIDTLLKACKILYRQKRAFELRIVGDGPLREELKATTSELGIADSVHFLLDTPRSETVANLVWSRVLVLCSEMESQGIVLQEAQATGSAVIGTNTGAIPESLVEGITGFLVPVGDSAALASALQQFIDDPQLIGKMGREGRKFVEEGFNVESERAQLRELYERAR